MQRPLDAGEVKFRVGGVLRPNDLSWLLLLFLWIGGQSEQAEILRECPAGLCLSCPTSLPFGIWCRKVLLNAVIFCAALIMPLIILMFDSSRFAHLHWELFCVVANRLSRKRPYLLVCQNSTESTTKCQQTIYNSSETIVFPYFTRVLPPNDTRVLFHWNKLYIFIFYQIPNLAEYIGWKVLLGQDVPKIFGPHVGRGKLWLSRKYIFSTTRTTRKVAYPMNSICNQNYQPIQNCAWLDLDTTGPGKVKLDHEKQRRKFLDCSISC